MHRALILCGLLAAASPAISEPFAYTTTEEGEFGILDLGSGAYTHCGFVSTLLFGLAVTPNGRLYGMDTGYFYRVNPHNGVLTPIASAGNNRIIALGSTEREIYGLDPLHNLYTIDPDTGIQTAVGNAVPTAFSLSVLSTAARGHLYESSSVGLLYDFIPNQGIAHRKGHETGVNWGAMALVDDVLYGAGMQPDSSTIQSIYTIDQTGGATIAVVTLSPAISRITGLAPTRLGAGTCRSK